MTSLTEGSLIYTFNGFTGQETQSTVGDAADADADEMEDVAMTGDAKSGPATGPSGPAGLLAHLLAKASTQSLHVENGGSTGSSYSDTLFLSSLIKCLPESELSYLNSRTGTKCSYFTFHNLSDPLLCPTQRAAHYLLYFSSLEFTSYHTGLQLTQQTRSENGPDSFATLGRTLPTPLAETILFGVLCGLHVNANNASTNMPTLIAAGLRVYHAVDRSVVQTNLRKLVTQALAAVEQPVDAQRMAKIEHSVQVIVPIPPSAGFCLQCCWVHFFGEP
ncbi:unnamed protein product [Echinostoma caproni]|uniref:Fungal_trans domain-containing protein n=1 Tax=Echinostoma caproni TaxID=27848 RepID=A0A183B928_9TREM|nr:unnamed protein product [Echinostoma caproni]